MTLIKDKIKTASHRELLANPKVQAMLKTIRYAEGTSGENGYTTRVGGGQFSDLSSKPGKKVFIKSINDYSSAEGAYQFLNSSWAGVSKRLGLKDFSPESQDLAAIDLIIQRGAMDNILKDDFQGAINKLSPEWASLPKADGKGTYANQKAKKIEQLSKIFYNGKVMTRPQQVVQQTQQVTTDNTNFETPQISTNLASVPDAPEKQEVAQAKQELQQKQNEENFINDLYAQRQEEEQVVQPQPKAQVPQANVLERYAQIENFVDEPIMAQQGGQLPVDKLGMWKYPNQEVIVPSSTITMKPNPFTGEPLKTSILGISMETGEQKIMQPNLEYFFKNTERVLEIPIR